MKNLKNLLAGVAFMSTCMLFTQTAFAQKPAGKPWPAPESAVKMKNPVKSDDGSMKEGKDLWAQHCKSCHGAKGKGDGSKAAKIDISCGDFSSADFKKATDGALYWKVTEGRKPMPSYKEKLSDSERWKVINFVRSM